MADHPKQKSETLGVSKIKRPVTSEMVNTAIRNLNDRGGSSLKAIIKYMEANYQIDVKKFMPYIKAHIKKSLMNGTFVQKTGVGLSGSFKLAKTVPKTKEEKQNPNKKVKEGDPEKEKVKKSTGKKASGSSSKSGKSGTKKTKKNAEDVKNKNDAKGKNDEVKKAKTKIKKGNVKEGKVNKGELKKSRTKKTTTTDAAKLKKIRFSILNGKLIKRKSMGAKTKKSKQKKAVEEP